MSENRTEQANNTVDFIDRIGGSETLADPAARREFLLNLDHSSFKEWLTRLNGLVRGTSFDNRDFDGESVYVMTMMPPEPQDKEALLHETLESAKRVLSEATDQEKALETASLILSGSINFIHPFADGNGRTSRVVGYLTRNGYDGSPEARQNLSRVLGEEGNTAFYNNPGVIDGWLDWYVKRQHAPSSGVKWPVRVMVDGVFGEDFDDSSLSHLSETSREKINKIMRDPAFGSSASTKVMIERNLLPEGVDFKNKDFATVEEEQYFAKFDDTDVDVLAEESRSMRSDRILTFLKAMENPESFKIRLDEKSDTVEFTNRITTLRDYYNEVVDNYSKIYGKISPLERRASRNAGTVLAHHSASSQELLSHP